MKKVLFPLHCMQIGKKVIIKKINSDDSIRRRFLDIGMIEGTPIECVLKSPFGDPHAYFVRGSLIAIRNDDASSVLVETID